MSYPVKRDLDGCYFRVKRDDKWYNLSFSDLTADERAEVTKDKDLYWFRRMLDYMTCQLRQVGDQLDIVTKDE